MTTSRIVSSLGRRVGSTTVVRSGLKIVPPPGQQAAPFFSASAWSAAPSSPVTDPPSSWVTTTRLEEDDRIAVLELHRDPANALSLEFCREISGALSELKEDPDTTAVVVASSLPSRIFSAGLDAPTELYRPDPDRLPEFWRSFQLLFLDLYGCTELSTVAALEGPAPAAGCMLALSCDCRAMLRSPNPAVGGGGPIGLNESHLGIVAPPWMCQQYIDVLGHRKAELALLAGTLFPPDQALEAGLVDELVVVEEEEDESNHRDGGSDDGISPTRRAAIAKAREFADIPAGARTAAKKLTRGPLVETLTRDRDKDIDFFCEFVTSDPVQESLGMYLEALAARSMRKKATEQFAE